MERFATDAGYGLGKGERCATDAGEDQEQERRIESREVLAK
ncbi:hypothetical protein [Vibrio fluminensis]|nr:hypothetical protein [Vibrio fluminensis]